VLDLVSLFKYLLLKTGVIPLVNHAGISQSGLMSELDQATLSMSQIGAKILGFNLTLLNFEPQFLILMLHSHILQLHLLELLPHSLCINSIIGVSATGPSLYA